MQISKIKLNPNNPRLIKDEKFQKLVKSIKEFPKMMALRPIIIDSDNMILGGNMRFRALQELKYKEIPDDWVKHADELTEEEKKRFVIADNVSFGEHDWDILANEWNVEDLGNWGLDIPFEEAKEEEKCESEEVEETDEENKGVAPLVYCCFNDRFDFVKGGCPHKCLYCYVDMSRIALLNRKVKVATNKEILNFYNSVEEKSIVVCGSTNDPFAYDDELANDALEYAIKVSNRKNIFTVFQTKNPQKAVDLKLDKCGIKVSFSVWNDELSRKIEPGCKPNSERIKAMSDCVDMGLDVVARIQPFFVGYAERYEQLIKDLSKAGIERIIVEPVRINAGAKENVGNRFEFIFDKHDFSIQKYIEDTTHNKMFGAKHWYDYDNKLLMSEYKKLKKMINDNGMKFGICSGVMGFQYGLLNEGDYCCQTEKKKEFAFDRGALNCRITDGTIKDMRVESLNILTDEKKRYLELCRIGWANDPQTPILKTK